MNRQLPLMTDAEVSRGQLEGEEAGFGALTTGRGPLPLKAMEVRGRIDGLLAQLTVSQTFVNSLDEPLEATYIFPLPDRAAVERFRMEVAGRVIEGVLRERGQAREDYERAIQAGHRASIAEEERPGVFALRVGNLMPGERATVRLTLAGPLPYSDGEVTFRFPLVVAPRYIPGVPLPGDPVGDGVARDTDAVPDASRISPPVLLPGYPNPVQLALTVDVHPAGMPVRDIRSSLHAALVEEADGIQRVTLHAGERLDRDFVLRFRLGSESVQTALSVHPDAQGDGSEGTFALTIVPPVRSDSLVRPRDIVFVLDRSGSMEGWKMVAARRAVARMVDALNDRDRFKILAFDDSIEQTPGLPATGLVPATNRNRFRAVEYLAAIRSRGGTEMAKPLEMAVSELSASDQNRDRVVVLVTDGQVGNEDQIVRNLGPRLKGLRLFAVGIDQAVNEGFLHRLTALTNGTSEFVESEERLDEVMESIHRRIRTPVLTEIRLESAGLRFLSDSLVPARMSDLFDGVPLLLLGRYNGGSKGALSFRAVDASGQVVTETLPVSVRKNPAIASVWARGRIRDLEDRFVIGTRDQTALEAQIVETSLRFGVLCRFTAFVAVDGSEVVNQGGQSHSIIQPVETPKGWAVPAPQFRSMARSMECVESSADMMMEDSGTLDCMLSLKLSGFEAQRHEPSGAVLGAASQSSNPMTGLWNSLRRRLRRRGRPSRTDLATWMKMAGELVERLERGLQSKPSGRERFLRQVAGDLVLLIEAITELNAAPETLRSLQELKVDLDSLLGQPRRTEADYTQFLQQARSVLGSFSQGVPPSTDAPRPGGAFWKS